MRPVYVAGALVLVGLVYAAVRLWRRKRVVEKRTFDGVIRMESKLVAQKIAQDGSEALRVVEGASNKSAADVAPDGTATFEIEGQPVVNESRTLKACTILVERLNRDGARWSTPRPPDQEGGVDCEATSGGQTLQIQVTQAATDATLWASLSRSGRGVSGGSTEQVAVHLWRALENKAKGIPPIQRHALTLALDASLSGVHVLPPVLQEFRSRYGAAVARLGFREVWIVGPTADLCARVDS
jgi:hypothetical protein